MAGRGKANPYVRKMKKEEQLRRIADEAGRGNVVDLPPLKRKKQNGGEGDGVVDAPELAVGRGS